ncbi:MAG: TIGR04002 family protein [Lachnospiraceae bacterium]|nr:TIGR04002 family protein [Lachnospiraceae bacterium]
MDKKIKNLTIAGIMAALITLFTAYICHIPMGANGAYIHFGDTLIYLAAALLPRPYALAAAAIGGGLADLLTAPMWAPATIIIKLLLVVPFTNKANKIVVPRNIFAAVIGYLFTGVGYFLAELILFENPAVFWVSMSQNLVQSVGSAVLFVAFGLALDKMHAKTKFFM